MSDLSMLKAFYEPKVFKHDFFPLVELEVITTEEARYYVTPEGKHYKSATTFLGSFDDDDPEWFNKWAAKIGGIDAANAESERCANRGTGLHLSFENLLLNKPEPEKHAGKYQKMFYQLEPALCSNISVVHALEACLYSDVLQLAGRVDCIATWAGKLSIVDFKTSNKFKKEEWIQNYFLQATIYSLMLEERTGKKAEQLVIAIAVEGEQRPQLYVKDRKEYIPILLGKVKEYRNKIEGANS